MHENFDALKGNIRAWGRELGFDAIGFSGINTGTAEAGLAAWLEAGFHGEMDYMAAHLTEGGSGYKRTRPAELVPGTRSIITARLGYHPAISDSMPTPEQAVISRYALGRDYHKLLRARLQKLADRITDETGEFSYRVFTDSAPVMEATLAAQSGLGWRGKHSLLLDREAGSWFFLGEIYTALDLPADAPVTDHCGTCSACIDRCPTQAIVAPGRVDARRCISYLTIELKSGIPEALRPLLGNRIYGCDDCQLACPWNRDAPLTRETDFAPRHGLDSATLVDLFAWDEERFNMKLAGSPIRRIGHERWLRNLAVAMGNALETLGNTPAAETIIAALRKRTEHPSALVREHVTWALTRR